jgi:CO/xanthine dehydrogenase Mo-binding subunit
VHIGAAEVGQGVSTVLTQIAAEALAIDPRRVRVLSCDTDEAPEAGSSSASRQTYIAGNAVRVAGERVRKAVAAGGGMRRLSARGVSRTYTFRAPRTQGISAKGSAAQACAYTWGTTVADVRVDVETGRVEVLRVVTAIDAGKVIHRRLFEGQVEGGAVMGQGYALRETCTLDRGMPAAGLGFERCGVPTSLDAPASIESIAIEVREPLGPFGARGIGEITMIPIVPAITSAIHAAVGVWVDEIPALPQRVLAALDSLRSAGR